MDRRLTVLGLALGLIIAGLLLFWPDSETPASRDAARSNQAEVASSPSENTSRSRSAGARGGRRAKAQSLPDLPIVESLPPGALGVQGQVFLQTTREPLPNAAVYLSDFSGEVDAVLSGEEGFFALESGHQGHFKVMAVFFEPGGLWLESGVHEILVSESSSPAGPVQLYVGSPGSVVLTVVDNKTRLPILGAEVKRLSLENAPAQFTNPRGRLILHGQPGQLKVQVSAEGYASQWANLELSADGPGITIALAPEALVHGIVQYTDGSPIADATVNLSSMVSAEQTVKSDKDGRFRFTNVVPFKPHLIGALKRLPNGTMTESKTNTFVTKPGDRKEHVLTLAPHTYLDPLGSNIVGQVVTEQQQPIPEADVVLYEINPEDGSPVEIGRTRSDEEGYFELPSIETDTERWAQPILIVRHVAFAPRIDMVNLMRTQTDAFTIEMRQGRTWQGTVVNEEGELIGNVSIRGAFGFTEYDLPLFEPEVLLSDSDGRFFLPNLPRVGRIFFHAEGYAPNSIELGGYTDLPAEMVLTSPRKIEGTVVDASSGQPLRSFSLEIQSTNILMRGFQSSAASRNPLNGVRYFANADGSFVLDDMPHGLDLNLWFEADQYASKAVRIARQQKQVSEIVVEMERDGLTVAGYVADEAGNPYPGATVWLTDTKSAMAWLNMPRNRLWGMMTQSADEMMVTDDRGQFRFENLATDRDWALLAWGDEKAVASRSEILAMPPEARENIVLQFPPSGGIRFVVNPDRGFDIKNISYAPVETPLATKSKSLDAGEFSWEVTGLAVDTYTVKFRAVLDLMSNGNSRSFESDVPVTVIAGEIIEVPLGFERTFNIGGRALWSGRPLGNASIFLLDVDGSIRTKLFTSATGDFLFEEVEEGDYYLFAPSNAQIDRNLLGWPIEAHPNRIALNLKGGDLVDTYEFVAVPNLVGQIANPQEVGRVYLAKPISGGQVQEFVMIRRLDVNGAFIFHGVPAGTYELRIWKRGADGLITMIRDLVVPPNDQAINVGIITVP
jgi:hypothetical protein